MFVFDVIITCKSTKLQFEPKLLGVEMVEQKKKQQKKKKIGKHKCNEKVHGWKVFRIEKEKKHS